MGIPENKRAAWSMIAAAVLIGIIVVGLTVLRTAPWVATIAAVLAGLCVILKEVSAAFARGDQAVADAKLEKQLMDLSAIASLYAAVFGVPAVVAGIVSLQSA